MASATKFLCPFRKSLTLLISSHSSISPSRQFYCSKLKPLKALLKGVRPVNIPTISLQKFCFSGSKLGFGSILGVSIVCGSISFWPNVGHAMDGHNGLGNDHDVESLGASDVEEYRYVLWRSARKFVLPLFIFLNVLVLLEDPITTIAFKLILFLLSTKPDPFSVYVFLDELCDRLKLRKPYLYDKSLYAQVEVEDFKLLCLARVELRDQQFTLVGIFGDWWPLPTSLRRRCQ